ncbi:MULTISPECIES: hypothetical protein [unclassified Streptomyces]|uniref:hypothetical protein n=1 Tax=unclassified Streptomyces TaxID=2593676 RepID=UPI00224EFDB2|nr:MULTISPECIES: hypothetical protein [unclassified Streptomyces]MCX4528709.1 hypothetical protein [Streptomyces sp. NBC_01551]MCX4540683.1 hypothetical protein [Streptomyces sp. NBC_01565]
MSTPSVPSGRRVRTDSAGAVYGSLLATSVVATAGTAGSYPRLQLILLLIVTGLVFWATHVYAILAGERLVGQPWSRSEIQRVALHEWPIVEAAVLPAAAVAISGLLGLDFVATAWLAMGVAVGQQVLWACLGAARAGATRRQLAAEGVVNLVLGLIIVATKAALKH